MKKKILFFLLLALSSSMVVNAYDAKIDGIYYDFSGSNATVTNEYEGSSSYSGVVIIPKTVTYNDITYQVTAIASEAFYRSRGLTSVSIPESVRQIGRNAFVGCDNLTKAEFASIASICRISFSDFNSNPLCFAKHLYIQGEEVFSLDISDVDHIGQYSFYGCTSLVSVAISEEVITIGEGSFNGCTGLTNVVLGENVASIGHKAFYNCSSLSSITIPNKITSIGDYAFYHCNSLTSVTINSNHIASKEYGGTTNRTLEHLFGNQVTNIIFGDNVERIGSYACSGMKNLTSIIVSDNLISIGKYAFDSSSPWYSNKPDGGVVYVGRVAYTYKLSHTAYSVTIHIQDGTLGIADYAFYANYYGNDKIEDLSGIVIPNSIIYVGENAFPSSWENKQPDGIIYCGKTAYKYKGKMPDNCSLEINDGTLFLAQNLFNGKYKLVSVSLPESLTNIESGAFSGCTGLTSISLPESLTNIKSGAFSGCTGLTSISIPENLKKCGEDAFSGCTRLKRADFVSTDCLFDITFENAEANPLYNAHYLYVNNKRVKSVTTPSITNIGSYTLVGCSLYSLIINSDVKVIGDGAFTGDSIKKTIWLPNTIPSGDVNCAIGTINYCAGSHYSDMEGNFFNYPSLSSKFKDNGIWYVRLNNTTCDVIDCDYSSTSIISPNVGPTVITYHEQTGQPKTYSVRNIMPYACYDDDCIKGNITISNQGYVGEYAFYNCSGARDARENITVSNQGDIGDYAFAGCSGITMNLDVSNHGNIGKYAFAGCTSDDANMGVYNKGNIGKYAFSGCTGYGSGYISNDGLIDTCAFVNCQWRESLTINNSGDIASNAFSHNIGSFIASINNLGSLGENSFSYSSMRSVDILSRVTDVKSCCFMESRISRSITIENSGYIGSSAFRKVTGTPKVMINNTGFLGDEAFIGAEMKSVTITNNVTSIGSSCFKNGSIAEQVTIENSGSIGSEAFSAISGGFDAYIRSTGPLPISCFDGSFMNQVEIGNGVTLIGDCCFQSSYFENCTIGNQVGSIGERGFGGAEGFKSIVIPNNVTSMGEYAFAGCTTMEEISLSRGLNNIEDGVFSGCTALGSLYIPNNIDSIKNHVFDNCPSLRTLTLEDKQGIYSMGQSNSSPLFATCGLDSVYVGGALHYNVAKEPYSPFRSHPSLRAVRFTDVEHQIYDREFEKCENLQEVYLGAKIDTIGHYAFSECRALEHFTVGPAVTLLGRFSFYNTSALKKIDLANTVLIKANSFRGCISLPQIEIPQTTLSIEDSTFINCTALKDLIIQDRTNVLTFGKNRPNCDYKDLTGVGTPLFADCPLDSVYIGGPISYSPEKIHGYSPFFYNESLRTVFVTNKEETVYVNEFWNCRGLQNIKLGEGVKTIQKYAFQSCSMLKTFEFASTLQTIGENAFSDTRVEGDEQRKGIEKIISHAQTPPVCGEQALFDINENICILYVPKGSEFAYENDAEWGKFYALQSMTSAISITLNKTTLCFLNIGETEILTATITPSDVWDKSVTWTSDNPNVAIIDNTGLVRAAGYGIATITATTNDGTHLTASCRVIVGGSIEPGDLNGDGEVDITDIILIIDVMSGQCTDANKMVAADINNDGDVDITDIIGAIDLMILQDASNSRLVTASAHQQTADYITASTKGNDIIVNLENKKSYSAFQMMVNVPDGLALTSAKLNNVRSEGHQLLLRQIDNNQYLIMGFSLDNEEFSGNSGQLLTLTTEGQAKGDIVINHVLFGTPDAHGYRLAGLTINIIPTSITDYEITETGEPEIIFDLQGRRIATPKKGLYIINGKKVNIR